MKREGEESSIRDINYFKPLTFGAVMKRTAITFSLIVMSFSVILSTQMVNLTEANSLIFPEVSFPIINILSPVEGQTYSSNDIWLNFTVDRPDDWLYSPSVYNTSEVYSNLGQILFVTYDVDNFANTNSVNRIEVNDPLDAVNPPSNFSFSVKLSGLLEGNHTVEVYAEGFVNGSGVGTNSPHINFAVYTPPEPESFTMPLVVAPATVVVVGVGLFVYFKKHKSN